MSLLAVAPDLVSISTSRTAYRQSPSGSLEQKSSNEAPFSPLCSIMMFFLSSEILKIMNCASKSAAGVSRCERAPPCASAPPLVRTRGRGAISTLYAERIFIASNSVRQSGITCTPDDCRQKEHSGERGEDQIWCHARVGPAAAGCMGLQTRLRAPGGRPARACERHHHVAFGG